MHRKFKLPDEIPEGEWPKPEEFVKEAKRIVDYARDEGVVLRVMGGLGIHMHSREFDELWRKLGRLGRKVFTDIDLATYGSSREKILDILKGLNYEIWKQSMYFYGGKRYIFFGRIPMVEIFFDSLEMNHKINFKGRLEKDEYTLPLAELLMSKLQIVKINEKDIKDTIVLIRAHDIGDNDKDVINGKHIARLLSKDWGFYYTFTVNLKKVLDILPSYSSLSSKDISIVEERVNKLFDIIEKEPKTISWKIRARIGPSKKWYNEVDEWVEF